MTLKAWHRTVEIMGDRPVDVVMERVPVGRGTIVGRRGNFRMVRWPDGLVVPYAEDQLEPSTARRLYVDLETEQAARLGETA